MNPQLGWIAPRDRTQEQNDAHQNALARTVRFALTPQDLPKGQKIILTDFWKKPEVIQDVGFEFNGFHQLTGSCVGASDGNATFTLGAIQRFLTDGATKAFLPFWPFSYGRSRFLAGIHGQGEGSIDSVMGITNGDEGIVEATESGLPQYIRGLDGLMLTSSLEMKYSDGNSSLVTSLFPHGKKHLVGTRGPINDSAMSKTAIINGYPILDGCDNYVGNGHIVEQSDNSYVRGQYTDRGGHSTCFLGYWNHFNDGPLFLYSNQWPTSTYPKDPAGGGRCCVWIPESEVDKLFRTGGDNGETMALSHMNGFPAQPKLLDLIL